MSTTLLNGLDAASEPTAQRLVHVALTPAELSLTGAYANNVSVTSSTMCSSGVLISVHLFTKVQRFNNPPIVSTQAVHDVRRKRNNMNTVHEHRCNYLGREHVVEHACLHLCRQHINTTKMTAMIRTKKSYVDYTSNNTEADAAEAITATTRRTTIILMLKRTMRRIKGQEDGWYE